MRRKWIFLAPLAILAIPLFIAIGGAVVQLLWNWLLPPLLGWHAITFWQAVGLLALCRILFGGMRTHGSGRAGLRRRMAERCGSMAPEDRERIHQRQGAGWGIGPSTSENQGG